MTYTKVMDNAQLVLIKVYSENATTCIPISEGNTDYATYLSWLSATQEERDAAGVIFAPDEILD